MDDIVKHKLVIKTKAANLQWVRKNGQCLSSRSNDEFTWVVESNYADRIASEDFLKQTGLEWANNVSRPSIIMNCNGWSVIEMK